MGSEDEEDSDDEDFGLEPIEDVICALLPGRIEQATLNLTFSKDEVVCFEVTGKK